MKKLTVGFNSIKKTYDLLIEREVTKVVDQNETKKISFFKGQLKSHYHVVPYDDVSYGYGDSGNNKRRFFWITHTSRIILNPLNLENEFVIDEGNEDQLLEYRNYLAKIRNTLQIKDKASFADFEILDAAPKSVESQTMQNQNSMVDGKKVAILHNLLEGLVMQKFMVMNMVFQI